MLLEAFIITNGRKTLKYVLKSIKKQTVNVKVTVVRDMKWVDALNKCARLSDCSFYLRIDDDMALHERAVEFYAQQLKLMSSRKVAWFQCKLWEDWSGKPAGSLKAYSSYITKKHKFKCSKLGKVDKLMFKKYSKIGFKIKKDNKSIVGLHMLADEDDQALYRSLWRDKNSFITAEKFSNTFDNKIHNFSVSLKDQYDLLCKIRRINKYKNSDFFSLIRKK